MVAPDEVCGQWEAAQGPRHVLTDRGEWTGDETYHLLDYVTEPGKTDTLLCLKENRSTSPGVLRNVQYWVPFKLPDN